MERQNDMFFTAWYGVFQRRTRKLRWAGGGHPPALLVTQGAAAPRLLDSDGPLIGAVDGLEFLSGEVEVPPASRLFVYSDGAFEIGLPDGTMWPFPEFVAALVAPPEPRESSIDALVKRVRALSRRDDFHDDFSMVELSFA
jgi:sigma-B regulation protein RsbU (phosphoserine phosphatase)